jgi:hypothetical protein
MQMQLMAVEILSVISMIAAESRKKLKTDTCLRDNFGGLISFGFRNADGSMNCIKDLSILNAVQYFSDELASDEDDRNINNRAIFNFST